MQYIEVQISSALLKRAMLNEMKRSSSQSNSPKNANINLREQNNYQKNEFDSEKAYNVTHKSKIA